MYFQFWSLCLLFFLKFAHAKLAVQSLTFTWGPGAPNGVSSNLILTNGQYPGPELVFEEDDDVEITVHNDMPFNTTVHWHGVDQRFSPWSDGVAGMSQQPIEPGNTFVYKFKASPAGTYWYHTHMRGLLQDGQVGSLYIHRKPETLNPYHLITNSTNEIQQLQTAEVSPNLLLLTDWNHLTSEEYYKAQVDSGLDLFCVDSILINGKGAVYCPGVPALMALAGEKVLPVLNGTNLTDKGCLVPELPDVQSIYLETANLSAVPLSMHYGCTPSDGGIHIVDVDATNGWASLNFIGGQALKAMIFSVDDHPMWIYEVDGGYVEPREVEAIQIYNGARYSVMIKLDKPPGNYSIRVADTGGDQVISGFATLRYAGASQSSKPQSIGPSSSGYIDYGGNNVTADVRQITIDPIPAFNVPSPAKTADQIHFTQLSRSGGAYLWTLSGRELFIPEEYAYSPILQNDNQPLTVNENAAIRTLNGTWVDIVLQVILEDTTPVQPPHPIHKHSNKAYLIAQEVGFFNWTSVEEALEDSPQIFNLENPPYRDTFTSNFGFPPGSVGAFMVIRYQVEIPGAFLLHCHIGTHQQSGMAMGLLDGVDAWPVVPKQYSTGPNGCNGAPEA